MGFRKSTDTSDCFELYDSDKKPLYCLEHKTEAIYVTLYRANRSNLTDLQFAFHGSKENEFDRVLTALGYKKAYKEDALESWVKPIEESDPTLYEAHKYWVVKNGDKSCYLSLVSGSLRPEDHPGLARTPGEWQPNRAAVLSGSVNRYYWAQGGFEVVLPAGKTMRVADGDNLAGTPTLGLQITDLMSGKREGYEEAIQLTRATEAEKPEALAKSDLEFVTRTTPSTAKPVFVQEEAKGQQICLVDYQYRSTDPRSGRQVAYCAVLGYFTTPGGKTIGFRFYRPATAAGLAARKKAREYLLFLFRAAARA